MFCSCLPDLGALSLHARATEMDAGPSEPRGRLTITKPPQYDPRKWGQLKAELEMKINALDVDKYKFQMMRELWERHKEWPGLVSKEHDADPDPVRGKKKRKDALTQYAGLEIHWGEMIPDYYEDVLTIVKKYTRRENDWVRKRQADGFGPSDAQQLREIDERRYKAQRGLAQQAHDQAQYRPPAADGPAFDWVKEFGAGATKPEMSDSEDDG
jgi:hypothetical protein